MSETTTYQPPQRPRIEIAAIAVIVALILGALWWGLGQRQQALRAAPTGYDGLQIWLAANEVSAQVFTGGWLMDEDSIGLMVMPLYDTAPDQARTAPRSKEELILQQDENDLTYRVIERKIARVDSLVVLPKWRSGLRLTGLGHPVLRVEPAPVQQILRHLTGDRRATLSYAPRPFTDFTYQPESGEALRASLYAAQTFTAQGCTPIIGTQASMLLASCQPDPEGRAVLVLADPDLFSNHGLRLGDNAWIARDFFAAQAGDKNVVIDYSRDIWLSDRSTAISRDRTWSDLLRFFSPPFTTLWLGAALTFALVLWRAARRYGPVRRDDQTDKTQSIEAWARLMRLSDQDGAMLRAYAGARISATASRLFGPANARYYGREETFQRYVSRRHPAHAKPLAAVLDAIHGLPGRLQPEEAIAYVDELERVLDRIKDDT